MNLLVTLRIAVLAILRNKLRSFLTTLGIMIGVAAVIAMMAIGSGARAVVESTFAAMGTNLLIVLPGSSTSGGSVGGFGTAPTLTWDDLTAIRSEVPSVKAAAPVLRSNQALVSDEMNWTSSVNGTSEDYLQIRNWLVARGNAFGRSELDGASKVVVLGQTVAEHLFGAAADPVGQSLRIGKTPFIVIGVLARKGQSPTGQDYDDVVLVPVTTFARNVQGGVSKYITGMIFVQSVSAEATPRALVDVSALLRDRHRLSVNAEDDFSIRNLNEIAGAQQQGTETITTLLASVAAVSLLVGGIGIMNIMLVSVTERTREIGIRMAIGAKPRSILGQFLIEALVLSLAGGLLGVVLGVGIATLMADRFGWPMAIQPDVILVSVAFSALVGVVFGLFPARKASKLDPIDALRYE